MDQICHIIKGKKIDFKRGASEIISLAIVLPIILMLVFAFLGIIQIGMIRQSLEYTAYLAGRTAVVCERYEDADKAARNVAINSLKGSTFGYDIDATDVKLELVSGTTAASSAQNKSDSNNGIAWEKGALLKISITTPAHAFYSYSNRPMTATIYMMVERPAKTYY